MNPCSVLCIGIGHCFSACWRELCCKDDRAFIEEAQQVRSAKEAPGRKNSKSGSAWHLLQLRPEQSELLAQRAAQTALVRLNIYDSYVDIDDLVDKIVRTAARLFAEAAYKPFLGNRANMAHIVIYHAGPPRQYFQIYYLKLTDLSGGQDQMKGLILLKDRFYLERANRKTLDSYPIAEGEYVSRLLQGAPCAQIRTESGVERPQAVRATGCWSVEPMVAIERSTTNLKKEMRGKIFNVGVASNEVILPQGPMDGALPELDEQEPEATIQKYRIPIPESVSMKGASSTMRQVQGEGRVHLSAAHLQKSSLSTYGELDDGKYEETDEKKD
jgi:hypothetical protein